MYGNNSGSNSNFPNNGFSNSGNGPEWQYQPYGSYHAASGFQSGAAGGPPSVPQPPKKRKTKSGTPWYVKLIAGAAACFVVSAGSIGGFVAMVNAGLVTLNVPAQSSGTSQGTGGVTSTIQQVSQNNSGGALTLQEVAAKVTPSVVCIQNYQGSAIGQSTEASEGSGIIMSQDGYIITNAHVVKDASALKVVLYDGTTYDAELIGSDTATDLALVKIEAENLTAATFGNADELTVGDQVAAIGNPGGLVLNSSVTFGYVSALNRSIQTSNGYTVNCIQTDAAINPGNSGGALVNLYGQVIGINSSKISATDYEGLGFAISINEALPVIESIKQYGYVKERPIIGISYQFIDQSVASYYRVPSGFYVAQINSENAERAGLEQGDVITKLDGIDASSSSVIAQALNGKKPGDSISLEVFKGRTGRTVTLTLVLSEYSAVQR
ncbi:MAG: trypsin-like serine protease [Oscillospiraceae bacterium]|nr:trypsin-like serine protease [Oscillospiraceae bacterium]